MSFYKLNMESMKQYRLNLYQKFNECNQDLGTNKLDIIESKLAKNGELFLSLKKNEKIYRLNSSYSPQYEAEKWVEQFSFNNLNNIITMFGFGNGTFVKEIIKNKRKNDLLIIYEPCLQLFMHVINEYDISDIIKASNVVIIIEGINEFDFHNLLQYAVNITNITSQIRCIHPNYDEVFPESAIKYWKEIKDNYIHVKLNINTEMFFGKKYISNSLFNTRFLSQSNRLLDFQQDFDTNIPAIIVAAGPSLKYNITHLKRVKGKAYIFVVDRILDYVLDEGLEPDFIVTIDPMKPIEYFTRRSNLKIPLLCELSSNWEVLKWHKGKKIIYSCLPYFQKMYLSLDKKPPMLTTGASVATAAFAACVQLGFKRIVLVGQDLAYDGEYTHAGGIAEKIDRTRDVMVEGVNGDQVRSRSDWYEFLIWFRDMIRLHPEIDVIDAKSQGAKIIGTKNMSLESVIQTYCTKQIENLNVFQTKKSTFDDTDMVKIRQYFTDGCEELVKLSRKSKEALEICDNQIRIYKSNETETPISKKNFEKISEINQFISKQSTYLLLESFITSSSAQQISELYHFTDNLRNDKIVTYEKSKSIFQAIIDGTKFAKPLLQEAIDNIRSEKSY